MSITFMHDEFAYPFGTFRIHLEIRRLHDPPSPIPVWTFPNSLNITSHTRSELRMSPAARGAFIVIEGLDRSGKSTQVARLVDRIQSVTTDATSSGSPFKAVPLKFPG